MCNVGDIYRQTKNGGNRTKTKIYSKKTISRWFETTSKKYL